MADLTPPSSQNNTPQRASTADPLVSPTHPGPAHAALTSYLSHPLSHAIPMDLDSATPTPAFGPIQVDGPSSIHGDYSSDSDTDLDGEAGAGRAQDLVAELSGGEGNPLDSDGEMDLEDGVGQFEEGQKDEEEGEDGRKKGGAGSLAGVSGVQQRLSKSLLGTGGKLRRSNKRGGPRRNQSGNAKPSRTNTANLDFAAGSGTGLAPGQKRRDGLYETDIVNRWNSSFGDVLAERATTPAAASTPTNA